jgi:hypothetical protein
VLAGPLTSAAVGLAGVAGARRLAPGFRASTLLVTLVGLVGLEGFAGYLLIAPFLATGDTYRLVDLLGLPAAARWMFGVVGMGAVFGIAVIAVPLLLRVTPDAASDVEPDVRRHWMIITWLGPWFVASALVVALDASAIRDVVVPVSVVSAGAFVPLAMALTRRYHPRPAPRHNRIRTAPAITVSLAAVVLAFDRLVLANGIHL